MDADITFVARLRSGGGSGSSLQLTVAKDVVSLLDLKEGDFIKVGVEKLQTTYDPSTSKGPKKGSS